MFSRLSVLVFTLALLAVGCGPKPPLQLPRVAAQAADGSLSIPGERPRFSPDGQKMVFQAGEEGGYSLVLVELEGLSMSVLLSDEYDNLHPTFNSDGSRVIFASNRTGNYDLFEIALDGTQLRQLTEDPADELEPAVSPLRYTFFAVYPDQCSHEGVGADPIDTYEKVAFSAHGDDGASVWFASLNGLHRGQISPPGELCHAPTVVWRRALSRL